MMGLIPKRGRRMAEAKKRQKWIVYLHRLVFDIMEDSTQWVDHRHPVGTTYAVSEKQAVNNVRFRTGAKEYTDQYSTAWLEAFTEDKDPGALNDWVYA